MSTPITFFSFLKNSISNFILANPPMLEALLTVPVLANAVLTPARVVVLNSNNNVRQR